MWLTGLVAPRHVGSSQTRARTRVPCIGRRILNHCATREALINFKNKFIYLFYSCIFGSVGSLLLRAGFFSSHGEQGLLFVVVRWLLIVVAFSCCGARALGTRASGVVAGRLSSCRSRALECRLSSCGTWA